MYNGKKALVKSRNGRNEVETSFDMNMQKLINALQDRQAKCPSSAVRCRIHRLHDPGQYHLFPNVVGHLVIQPPHPSSTWFPSDFGESGGLESRRATKVED